VVAMIGLALWFAVNSRVRADVATALEIDPGLPRRQSRSRQGAAVFALAASVVAWVMVIWIPQLTSG
jgi:hypothetical protein